MAGVGLRARRHSEKRGASLNNATDEVSSWNAEAWDDPPDDVHRGPPCSPSPGREPARAPGREPSSMIVECRLGPHYCPFEEWTPHQGRVFDGLFAVDTETLLIDDENPQIVPPLVLATACDDRRGFFLARRRRPLLRGPPGRCPDRPQRRLRPEGPPAGRGRPADLVCSGRARPGLGYLGAQAAAGAGDRGAYRAGRLVTGGLRARAPRARAPQGTPR